MQSTNFAGLTKTRTGLDPRTGPNFFFGLTLDLENFLMCGNPETTPLPTYIWVKGAYVASSFWNRLSMASSGVVHSIAELKNVIIHGAVFERILGGSEEPTGNWLCDEVTNQNI